MLNFESLSRRPANVRANFHRRRNAETETNLNDKVRTMEVYREALNVQIIEKKKREEAAKEEQKAQDAEMLLNSKLACLLHGREVKERRAMETSIVNYWHQCQQPQSQQEKGLNDPDDCRKAEPGEAQMMPPGLLGEDRDVKSRRQRQKEQLREWLIQQQRERAAERHQRKLEEQRYDQSRVEMDQKALQLYKADMERRKAATVATTEFNLVQAKEKRHLEGADDKPSPGMAGMPGLHPSGDRKAPPESLQQILQFQKNQIEEKKRMELEKKQEVEQHDRVRVDSAHRALLRERTQARQDKQLRQQLDSINVKLAQTHKQQRPDIERGCIDDSFFSKFNTSRR